MTGAAVSLSQLKAEFFKTLGHPVRIRVLELLDAREHAVAELLSVLGVEAAALSQQLAVLRRSGLVASRRDGNTVFYRLAEPSITDLLAAARTILTTVLASQADLLDDLLTTTRAVPAGQSHAAPRRETVPTGAPQARASRDQP